MSQISKDRRKPPRKATGSNAALATTLKQIDHMATSAPKAARVISLLKSWLKDESGYDERTWPKLKKALDEQRLRTGAASLFDE